MPTNPQITLTEPQQRLLIFCVTLARGEWVSLAELDQIRLLEADDVLTVPSLIERKLLEHNKRIKGVRATEAAKVIING